MLDLGIIDGIINEPLGGAHCNYEEIGNSLKTTVMQAVKELKKEKPETLKQERYNKFRRMGVFCQ